MKGTGLEVFNNHVSKPFLKNDLSILFTCFS